MMGFEHHVPPYLMVTIRRLANKLNTLIHISFVMQWPVLAKKTQIISLFCWISGLADCRWSTFISSLLNHSTCCTLLDSNMCILSSYICPCSPPFYCCWWFFCQPEYTLHRANVWCLHIHCSLIKVVAKWAGEFTNLAVKHPQISSVSSCIQAGPCWPIPICPFF